MCGICGFIGRNSSIVKPNEVIKKMNNKLMHRGPDDENYLIRDNVALGFRRLSIIDLQGGRQPITNENNSIALICNGEIFNHSELRRELIQKGHKFKTKSDVEVILHLYEEYDKDFLNKLNGQFAFSIYDFNKEEVFCARDQAGIVPFYYTLIDGCFIFASEIKAILEYPDIKKEVDLIALDQILTFPSLVSPRTMFKGISSLENGFYLTFSEKYGLQKCEYWDVIYPKENEKRTKLTCYEYISKLEELLLSSVKYRLGADVPVGLYLSGGLDSSLIAGITHKLENSNSKNTFSIDFEDDNISESAYQKMMSKHISSIHFERTFKFEDEINNLKRVIYHTEYPLKETYDLASIRLSEMVRNRDMKVVLSGEGADELFGGYIGYKFDKIRSKDNKSVTEEGMLHDKIFGNSTFVYEKRLIENECVKKKLYSQKIKKRFNEVNCLNYSLLDKEKIIDREIFDLRSYIDFKLRLVDNLLADHGDRMGFANSVEVRYPFLDKRIIEFATQVPTELKLKGFDGKYILKKIADKYIPKEIIKRPKTPFVAPGSPELLKLNNSYINEILSYETIKQQGYFDPDTIEELKEKYSRNDFKIETPYEDDLLFIVITFGIFLNIFDMPALNSENEEEINLLNEEDKNG
ncbi:asparagine synthase (glutamine-hydrolyzing) [Clostridium tagluense]|uniref:asparagine synthase (glutamine-hydrolyzing) n=1 Tax=Clostridium tagluense TaxID=360422 RepID=UPI001CF1D59B|nr:asparagine synthase (glutamine-hydrolyzing) [Clostridium tagluense]MCB2298646.1 asparagine synthase (glutamine-hydrolyzing) [Clostridium tagluense]